MVPFTQTYYPFLKGKHCLCYLSPFYSDKQMTPFPLTGKWSILPWQALCAFSHDKHMALFTLTNILCSILYTYSTFYLIIQVHKSRPFNIQGWFLKKSLSTLSFEIYIHGLKTLIITQGNYTWRQPSYSDSWSCTVIKCSDIIQKHTYSLFSS